MRKGLVAVMVLALLLLSVSMTAAQEKATCEKAKMAGSADKATCQKEMKLSDEQKGKIDELKTNFRLNTIDLKAEQEKLGIMLKKELMKPEPAMQDVEGIIKKMSAVREKLQLARIEHMLAMRKLLGPDWKKIMRPGMGCCEEMMGGSEMMCCPEMMGDNEMMGGCPGEGAMVMPEAGSGSPRMKGGCMMSQGRGMGEKGGCTMHLEQGMGEKGKCMIVQKGEKCCPQVPGKWHGKMFRPFGKKCCMEKCTGKEIRYRVEIREGKER